MKKRLLVRKRWLAAAFALILTLASIQSAAASTLSNAREQKNEAQSNLDSVNSRISEIKRQQADLQSEIDALDNELVQVLLDIDMIGEAINNKKVELAQAEADLATAQEEEKEQYEAMKQRIRFMYENGDSSFLDALVGADSFADVLNKVENFSKVYDFDRSLLIEYQNTKEEVSDLVVQVAEEKEELEASQATYEEQQHYLEQLKAEKSSQMEDFAGRLAQAQDLAAQYKATIDRQSAIIEDELAAQRKASMTAGASSAPSSSGSSSSGSSSGAASAGVGDLELLAAIIYCEAGGETYAGQLAVGAVVMNRVRSGSFPNSISGVIYQSGQFTPASSGRLARALNGSIPGSCYQAATEAMGGADNTGGALYFHSGTGGGGTVIGNQTFY